MKLKILYIFVLGFMWGNLFASGEVPITHPSCKYTVQYPEGWDTVPLDTIKNRLKNTAFDLGIYPVSQKHYFDGNYILTGFMPVMRSLSSFTFDQIVRDVTAQNKQSEIVSDTMDVRFVKIVPDAGNRCLHSYFSIRKDTVTLENCQSLYLTKFGYVTVLFYRKADAIPLDEILGQMNGLIQIHPDYRYTEPEKKGITLRHIIISLAIGLLVYALISIFTKKRRAS
jgi:hypothetical protein